MEDSIRRAGEAVRRQLSGDEAVDRARDSVYASGPMRQFIEVSEELIYGRLWTRPGLDLKTRALITVVSTAATGRIGILPVHVSMALRQGWTQEEITEALLHLIGYVGAPTVREAMLSVTKLLARDAPAAEAGGP